MIFQLLISTVLADVEDWYIDSLEKGIWNIVRVFY